jgi:predicted transcriptional regulator
MRQANSTPFKKQIDWRRSKVLELLVQGQNQYDISEVLQISQPTISRDVQYLRSKAKEEIKLHINEKLPEEYQRCLTGINQVLKFAWDMANKLPQDNRLKLQALSLANDCYKYKMDLLTNVSVLRDAIKFVENTRDKLEAATPDISSEKVLEDNITDKSSNSKNDIQRSSDVNTRNNVSSTRTTNQTF